MRYLVLLGVAALALGACDRGDKPSATAGALKAASVNAPSPLESPFTLKGAAAVDVNAALALLPPELRPTYQAATFDAALGATVLTGVSLGEEQGLTIARVELYGLDQAAVARVVETEATNSAAPFEQIFAKIRFFDLSANSADGGAPVSIAAGEIDRLRIRQGAFADDQEGSGLASIFNAFELGGLYVKDAVFGANDENEAFGVTAPDLRLVGVSGGKLEALVANRLEYRVSGAPEGSVAPLGGPFETFLAPRNQRVAIRSLNWRGLDLSGMLPFGLREEKPPVTARDLVKFGELTALDVETWYGDRRFSFAPKTTLSADFIWIAPSKIRSVATDAVYDLTAYFSPNDAAAVELIKKHGLDKLKADSRFSYDWEPKSGAVSVKSDISAPAAAIIDFSLAADGLEINALAAALDADASDAALGLVRLKSATLKLRDEVMLDAFFDLAALEAGGAGKDMRAAAPALVRLAGVQAAVAAPAARGYFDAIASFVEKGGSLTIKVNPQQPMSLTELGQRGASGPDAMVQSLGVEVTHTPK